MTRRIQHPARKKPPPPSHRDSEFRKRVADLALRVKTGHMTFFDMLDQIADKDRGPMTGDRDVDELINLLEHLPDRRGFIGVGTEKENSLLDRINRLIQRLSG